MDESLKPPERLRRRPLLSQNHLAGVDLAFPKLSPKSHSEDNRPNATVPAGCRTLGWQSIALSLSGNRAWNVRFSGPKQGEQHAIWGFRYGPKPERSSIAGLHLRQRPVLLVAQCDQRVHTRRPARRYEAGE